MIWIKAIGFFIFAALIYIVVSTIVSITPIFSTMLGIAHSNPVLLKLQREYYFVSPMRSLLQGNAACVLADHELGYRIPIGDCNFDNFEFSTVLKFNAHGALMPKMASGPHTNLMIIGDSHAMGWGSSYNETFSYLLGEKGYAVTNLAMSSYGTEQEIKSALLSDKFRHAEYIIIQYCDNDLGKNLQAIGDYSTIEFDEYKDRVRSEFSNLDKLRNAARLYQKKFSPENFFTLPLTVVESYFEPVFAQTSYDGADHRKSALNIIQKYDALKDKKIFVFYVNGHGTRFHNWTGTFSNVQFIDLKLEREHFFSIDDHVNAAGHKYIAKELHSLISQNKNLIK
jgi:hypothetical protein